MPSEYDSDHANTTKMIASDSLTARNIATLSRPEIPAELLEHVEAEVGDLFFVLVNIARYLSVDPESALRKTNRKFRRRFGWMEEQLREQGRTLEESTLEEMEALWQQAKMLEVPKP